MPFDLREEALRGLVAFRDVLDHLITESLTRHNGERPTVETNAFPVDVVEQAGSYILQASLPGVTPEGLSIQTRGNIITIRGQRAVREAQPHQQWIQCEQHATTFARAITLPFAIDADLSIASFEHGVLTLELPMTESAKLKTITLGTATPADLVIEEIIVAEPVAEEIIVEEIVIEEPLALEIIVAEPVIEEVFTEKLIVAEDVVAEPIAEETITEEMVAEEIIVAEPVVEEPIVEEPVAEELMVAFVAEMLAEEAALDEPFTMAYLEEAEMVALAVAILAESEVMEAIAEMDSIVAANIIDMPLATAEGLTSETLEGVILEPSDESATEFIAEEVTIEAAIAMEEITEEAIAEEIVIEAAIAEEVDAEEIALQEMIAAEAIAEVLADVELHEIHADVVTDAEIIDIRAEIKEVA